MFFLMLYIDWQILEVGDFEAIHFQLSTNVDRSNAFDLTTLAPTKTKGCYAAFFLCLSDI